ncbi:transposase (IS4 family protein), partial [mine drainage metagenome]
MTAPPFQLRSQLVGPLPVINAFLDRLGVERLLEQAIAADPRVRVHPAVPLGVVLRSVIEGRLPLYALGEWVAERDPRLLAREALVSTAWLNDDRVGRALEGLFDADRAQLQTALVVQALRRFAIDCAEFHNDSTSLTFTGVYPTATGAPRRGQPTAAITWGHSKDHRDDLKQLLWILTVSADGAVPVHYRVADGSTEDSTTHRATWDLLCQLAGRTDFLYVADSKLCT